VKQVPCPRCGRPAAFVPDNKWRPFCSERCKIVDLGNWGSERYRVPTGEDVPGESLENDRPEEKP
jgi:endogenous inhibitor of DNA gyrase (YacG/DUF329 family)